MIKTVKKIGVLTGRYKLPIDIFELSEPIKIEEHPIEAQFLAGAFYNQIAYPMVALYASDENGYIIDSRPLIEEDGISSYEKLFRQYGYTLI